MKEKQAPTLIRAPGGSGQKEVPLRSVTVPDLWHLYVHLKSSGCPRDLLAAEKVLETWHLCHDLLVAVRRTNGID